MSDLTPETLAELRRLLDAATPGPWRADGDEWIESGSYDDVLTPAPVECMAYCYGGTSRVNLADADRALIVAAVNALPDILADLADAEAARDQYARMIGDLAAESSRVGDLAAERDVLAAMLSGRCRSDITHRDEEHRQSVCMLPEGHAPLAHDDCMGCTWTDADHWQPSAVDRVADEVARIADDSQHEDWDSPRVRSIVGRILRALDESEADR